MNLKTKNNTEINRYELMFEVTPEEFDNAVNAIYKKESRKLNIPGFRKGKAPRKFIEKYYGEEVFYDAAIDHVYRDMVNQAVENSELDVVAVTNVSIEEIGKDVGIQSKITVVTKPDVDIKDYKGIALNKEIAAVTEEEIENEIESVRERNSRMVEITDKPAEDGDTVVIDFDGSIDGVPFDGGQAENHELSLGSGQFIPGFEEQIVGHSIDEEFDVNVKFPEDYHSEDLKDKDAVFKVKIHEIKKKELPDVDDEFVKDVSEFDTLDEYKADIEKNLMEKKTQNAEAAMENDLVLEVVERLEAEIPHEMIHNELDEIINNMAQRLQSQGLTLETYFQYTGQKMEDLHRMYHPQAETQVKIRLALEKIGELEDIKATEEELEEELKKLAENYKMELEDIKKVISSEMLSADIVNKKTMEFLRDNAAITELTHEEMEKAKEAKLAAKEAKEAMEEEAAGEEE